MIFWAWKGRIVLLDGEKEKDKLGNITIPEIQKFELVEIVDPALYRDDSKMYVRRLNTGYSHYVSRENCYPLRKLKKVVKN